MEGVEKPMRASEYRRREAEILFGIELLYRQGLSDFALDEEFATRTGRRY